MDGDHASHVASNVWQLGLVFARLIFGGDVPTKRCAEGADDRTAEGRSWIRESIRDDFRIHLDPAYIAMYQGHGDVLRLLHGMLQRDETLRLTAKDALRMARGAAISRGLASRLSVLPRDVTEGRGGEGWGEEPR